MKRVYYISLFFCIFFTNALFDGCVRGYLDAVLYNKAENLNVNVFEIIGGKQAEFVSEAAAAETGASGWFVSERDLWETEEDNGEKKIDKFEKLDFQPFETAKKTNQKSGKNGAALEKQRIQKDNETESESAQNKLDLQESIALSDDRYSIGNYDVKLAASWFKREAGLGHGKNFVISPLSLYSLSVVLANGVVDESLLEFSRMFSVLKLREVNKQLKTYLTLKKNSVQIFNSLWGRTFSMRYQKLAAADLGTEVWGLAENTAPINDWISSRTAGKVRDIVPVNTVSDNGFWLVGNAYFNGKWVYPFDKKKTVDKVFHNLDGTDGKVRMMQQKGNFFYYEDAQMQAVRLFYQSGDYITFYLPRPEVDFGEYAENFDQQKFDLKFRRNQQVNVKLPKFDMMYNTQRTKNLFGMLGVRKVFQLENYDFVKMLSMDEAGYVKHIVLNAGIKVDEIGGEADLGDQKEKTVSKLVGQPQVDFIADRPFIFTVNRGDFVGAFVSAKVLSVADKEKLHQKMVGEVEVKMRKNGDPAWYEEKGMDGKFKLKSALKKGKEDKLN